MKKFLTYIANVVLCGCMFASCAQEELTIQVGDNTSLTLEINSGKLSSRAATVEDIENSIKVLDIFLYPNGATDQDAVVHVTETLSATDMTGETSVTVNVPSSALNTLFSDGATECTAYVLANMPNISGGSLPSSTDITSLKGTAIQADFSQEQTLFVMDGTNQVNYNATSKKISGEVELVRAASKISLVVTNVSDQVKDDFGNIWKSDVSTNKMQVGFYNGVKKAHVDVTYPNCQYQVTEDDRFNVPMNDRQLAGFVDTESQSTHYTHESPFYSYSSEWESGSATAPYLILVVPWQKIGEDGNPVGEYQPCYYQIPINETNKKLERNHYYEIKLNVGILGSFTPDEPLLVDDASYVVLDWSEALTSAALKEYHYLVVDKNLVELYNKTSTTISYEACEKVTMEIVSMTVPDFSTNVIGTIAYSTTDSNSAENIHTIASKTSGTSNIGSSTSALKSLINECSVIQDVENKTITFTHALQNNNQQTPYDYAMYTVVVRLTTECGLSEDIEIKQYPARYIEGELDDNPNYSYTKLGEGSRGTVFVNGYGGNDKSEGSSWYWVNNTLLGTGYNGNPNMYVVTITTFDDTQSDFIIGDPRESEVDNLTSSGWTSAPTMYDEGNRTLNYYYPTRTDNANFIAPKLRITSAYGRLSGGSVSETTVKQRCASYQEAGYPAGRWRLPTAAELQYIGKLCADGVIPPLFNNGAAYYSATGGYEFADGSFTYYGKTAHSVRCVYDEWYWTDKCDELTFTWGDKEITW